MANILVTGGAGAIGSNLVNHLLSNQHKVMVIDDLSSGSRDNLNAQSVFFQGSILDDDLLENIFTKNNIEYVFHLAALFANQNSVQHPEKDLMINGLGTLKILEKSKLYDVKKVIYTSSSCVYGNTMEMEEDKPLTGKLDTPYAITKLLGEQYCKFYSDFHGLSTVIVRLFNSYGPGEKPGIYRNVIPNFFYRAMKGESLVITGTGEETRDFTFVEDVTSSLCKVCFQITKAGEIFNLGSGRQTSIQELVELINKMTGNTAEIIYHSRRTWDHVLHRVANIEKSKSVLGYKPEISIDEGLIKTYNWLKNCD
jgi:nucleoside-diphosphate-sugar epimerase